MRWSLKLARVAGVEYGVIEPAPTTSIAAQESTVAGRTRIAVAP